MLPGGGTRLRPARPGGRAELPAGGPQPAHQPAHQPGPGHSVTSLISRQSQEGGPQPPTGGRSDGHLTRVGSGGQTRQERVRRELLELKLLQWRQPEYLTEGEEGRGRGLGSDFSM